MSVLSYPRIHFQGRCLINPPTADNDADVDQIDTVRVKLLPGLAGMESDEARSWLMKTYRAISPINQKLHTYVRSGWNYFGEASVRFLGVEVTSVVTDDGEQNTSDPIVGQEIQLLGSKGTWPVICDVDPTGVAAVQIFIGGLSLGCDSLGLTALHDTRVFCRWIVWRNVEIYQGQQNFVGAGATWQFSIPGQDVCYQGLGDSPVLAELAEVATAPHRGIQVQFCFYLTKPLISDTALAAMFQAGFEPCNPAEAFMVGTIGVWNEGEPRTVPDGRVLLMPPLTPTSPNFYLGPAAARVHLDRHVVSLNLITAVPEANYDRPPTSKANLGHIRLGLVPPGGHSPIPISPHFDYDNASYLKNGGIVNVPYDPAQVTADQLEHGTLVVLSDLYSQQPILTEAFSTRTVVTDDGAIYFDEQGEDNEEAQDAIFLLVRERGRPPSEDVTISLWEYQFVLLPAGNQQRASSALTLVAPGSPLGHRLDFPETVTFPKHRKEAIEVPITAIATGPLILAFTLNGQPPGADFPLFASSFIGVRVLPDDDYDHVPDEELTWEFMYHTVFRYYYVIFPGMSKIIPFNNQKRMEAAAHEIVRRTDPDLWHSTLYMPVTRDLSKGKRELIVRWARPLPQVMPAPPKTPGKPPRPRPAQALIGPIRLEGLSWGAGAPAGWVQRGRAASALTSRTSFWKSGRPRSGWRSGSASSPERYQG